MDIMSLAERYRGFAEHEARGSSPLYRALANHVAESAELLAFLSQFPAPLQQPNLFLAATRLVAGTPDGPDAFARMVLENADAIAHVMRTRTTQTNEPGRCAALLPVLSRMAGPIALIEVGASAGLCLLPDKYAYDYGRLKIDAPAETRAIAPTLVCNVSENAPLSKRHPHVVWRAGLDLNPLRVDVDEDMKWLSTLVWPEQHDRLGRLNSAVDVARVCNPGVVRGDLRTDLEALAAQAPSTATLVVFHAAVLGYVASQEDRDAFAKTCTDIGATWISNEWPNVFPAVAAKAIDLPQDKFLISVNGEPVAWTPPHGQALDWIAAS